MNTHVHNHISSSIILRLKSFLTDQAHSLLPSCKRRDLLEFSVLRSRPFIHLSPLDQIRHGMVVLLTNALRGPHRALPSRSRCHSYNSTSKEPHPRDYRANTSKRIWKVKDWFTKHKGEHYENKGDISLCWLW